MKHTNFLTKASKGVIGFSLAFGIIYSTSVPSLAVTPTTIKQERIDTRITNLKTRGTAEIERRITALNNAVTRISQLKKISQSQKDTLISEIKSEITSLTTLKTKIASDTDLATLRTDVQSIVQSHRIFALYLPKVHILAAADVELQIIENTLQPLVTSLQTKITQLQAQGKDVTEVQTNLTSIISQINTAKTKAQSAISTVTPLMPSGYPDNKTQLLSARDAVKASRQSLKQTRDSLKKLAQDLKAL